MKKLIGYIYCCLSILVLILSIYFFNYYDNNGIKKDNAVTTEARIVGLSNINTTVHKIGRLPKLYYNIQLYVSYNINGVNYTIRDNYSSSNKDELLYKFHINDPITVTYDKTNPSKSFVGSPNYNLGKYVLYMSPCFIFMGIGIIYLLGKEKTFFKFLNTSEINNKPQKNKKSFSIYGFIVLIVVLLYEYSIYKTYESDNPILPKFTSSFIVVIGVILALYYFYKLLTFQNTASETLHLKVLQVDIIDYERERVFFSGDNHLLYLYETDFGEEFKSNQVYTIKLSSNNLKYINSEFQGQNIKVCKIVNLEKSSFTLD